MEKVIIIGTGPAGLTAAIYTARANLQPLVVDGLQPGGQLTTTTGVENYPGFPDGVAPFELMENFRKSAVKFGAQFVTDAAKAIRRDPDGKTWIVACGKAEYPARAVLVASGAQYRRLGLKNEGRLIGRGVS